MALSQHEWESAIKVLDGLATAPACGSGSTPAAAARAHTLLMESDLLLLRLQTAKGELACMTEAAWDKLVNQEHVCT